MPTSPTQQTQTPSQMLLGMGMMQPGQMDTYGYYMGTPMFTRQPVWAESCIENIGNWAICNSCSTIYTHHLRLTCLTYYHINERSKHSLFQTIFEKCWLGVMKQHWCPRLVGCFAIIKLSEKGLTHQSKRVNWACQRKSMYITHYIRWMNSLISRANSSGIPRGYIRRYPT